MKLVTTTVTGIVSIAGQQAMKPSSVDAGQDMDQKASVTLCSSTTVAWLTMIQLIMDSRVADMHDRLVSLKTVQADDRSTHMKHASFGGAMRQAAS